MKTKKEVEGRMKKERRGKRREGRREGGIAKREEEIFQERGNRI